MQPIQTTWNQPLSNKTFATGKLNQNVWRTFSVWCTFYMHVSFLWNECITNTDQPDLFCDKFHHQDSRTERLPMTRWYHRGSTISSSFGCFSVSGDEALSDMWSEWLAWGWAICEPATLHVMACNVSQQEADSGIQFSVEPVILGP